MFYKKLIYLAPVSQVLSYHTRRNVNSVQQQLLCFKAADKEIRRRYGILRNACFISRYNH